MNEMLRDAEFKDERPLKTVEKIKNILKTYGIETEETWYDSGVPYCYSIRVSVVGTTFGVNGKGLTKEFTLASGYGELMERLQLGYVGSKEVQKDGVYSVNDTQDRMVSARKLYETDPGWYKALAERLQYYTNEKEDPQQLLMQYADAKRMISATPYYNVTKGCTAYFPAALRKRVYTANGCAAGNTMEEAVVQGISEIVERNHQLRIVTEGLAVPDVPEDVLKRYKTAYEIISYARLRGFKVAIKDCSLGTKYPVVCAVFIDGRSGKYHTHFGAYPIFEIALERALTETFQGLNIGTIARFEDFAHKQEEARSITGLANELTKGTWEKSPAFFVGKPQYPFHSDVGFRGTNNLELLRECIRFFEDQGYDVLIRDCSCLGFPTYQILVPGYSEIFAYRLSRKLDDNRYFAHAIKALRDPAAAKVEDLMGLLRHLNETKKMTSNISDVHGFRASAKLSAKMTPAQDQQMLAASLAYVYYTLGDRAAAITHLQSMINGRKGEDVEYLICIKRYLTLLENGYDSKQVREILDYFHNEATVEGLYTCLENGVNPLDPYVLHCDMSCDESCLLCDVCCQKRAEELTALIGEKTSQLDFDAFAADLRALLQM